MTQSDTTSIAVKHSTRGLLHEISGWTQHQRAKKDDSTKATVDETIRALISKAADHSQELKDLTQKK